MAKPTIVAVDDDPGVSRAINARMGYQRPSTVIRRLDDALLAIFTHRYLALHGNAHRLPLLRARLEKLSAPEGG